MKITAINGQVLDVDTSDEACGKHGFKHGEKIIDPFNRSGVVVGVAPIPKASGCATQGEDVLWVYLDMLLGKACFFPNPDRDLRKVLSSF